MTATRITVGGERPYDVVVGDGVLDELPGLVAKRSGLSRPRIPMPGNPRGMLRAMLEQRRPLYEGLASVTVPTSQLSPEEIAGQIAADREHSR